MFSLARIESFSFSIVFPEKQDLPERRKSLTQRKTIKIIRNGKKKVKEKGRRGKKVNEKREKERKKRSEK